MNRLERRIERVEERHRTLRSAALCFTSAANEYTEACLMRAARAYAAALRTLSKGTKP